MNKIDLIVEALKYAKDCGNLRETQVIEDALAAARELRELKPVGYMDSRGVLFNKTTHPQLNTALYALDEVTK